VLYSKGLKAEKEGSKKIRKKFEKVLAKTTGSSIIEPEIYIVLFF
jgi:hypothetical protein